MPHKITQHYKLTGWETVVIYSEQEMADALNLTCAQLRNEIEHGNLGYHAHPSSNALREYQFLTSTYLENQLWWGCLQAGGHSYKFSQYYDLPKKLGIHICRDCGREKYD